MIRPSATVVKNATPKSCPRDARLTQDYSHATGHSEYGRGRRDESDKAPAVKNGMTF